MKDEEERMQADLLRDFIEFGDHDNADHYDQFCPPVTFGAATATSIDPQTGQLCDYRSAVVWQGLKYSAVRLKWCSTSYGRV